MDDIDVRTYFAANAPQIPRITVRAVNALMRGGIDTMEQLCSKSDEELGNVRNMGKKSLELALAMRDKYANTSNIHWEDTK